MKQKVIAKGEGKKVRVLGIPEFITAADSDALDAESPCFENVAGAEVPRDVPGGVGTTPMEEVEVEEEDPDVHFKRKRKGEPYKKRVVKKPRRHTHIITESESTMVALLLTY